MTTQDFNAALIAFVDALQTRLNKHYAANFKNLTPPVISTEAGSKYVRVIETRTGVSSGRSVHCFVRKSDGAILKAAGWKAPFIAKGGPNCAQTIRGSIFVNNGQDAVTEYGARYL